MVAASGEAVRAGCPVSRDRGAAHRLTCRRACSRGAAGIHARADERRDGGNRQQIRFCAADGTRIAYATVGSARRWCALASSRVRLESRSGGRGPSFARPHGGPLRRRASGLSDWDVADISFDSWFADLEAVVSAVRLARFALFGMSRGAPARSRTPCAIRSGSTTWCSPGGFARGRCRVTGQQADEMRLDST